MRFPSKRAARTATAVLSLGLLLGAVPSAGADDGPLPASCKLHPTKVVNPGCVPAVAEQATATERTYPNLVPTVTEVLIGYQWTYDAATDTFTQGPPELWFDTWAQNLGTVPVDILADEPLSSETTRTVSQCVSWTTTYVCRERQPAGGFSWHEEHQHFHFNDFAKYQLRRLTAAGAIDFSDAGLIARSDKVSFCLIDSAKVDPLTLALPTYRNCDNIRQGVSPGWADIYGSGLPGQQFPIADLASGRYGLTIDMNTSGVMVETDYTDNRVEAIIEFDKALGTASIVSTTWP